MNEFRPELKEAWEAYQSNDFDKAYWLLNNHITSPDIELANEAKKLNALIKFQSGNYSEAYPIFLEVSSSSNDVNDWFNVVTSSTLAGKIEISENAFARILKIHESTNYTQTPPLPIIRQYYACALRDVQEYSKALTQLNELTKIYEQLKITDDTFLYMRGVPFLSHTTEVALDVFNGMNEKVKGKEWLESFSQNVDDLGKEYLLSVTDKLK